MRYLAHTSTEENSISGRVRKNYQVVCYSHVNFQLCPRLEEISGYLPFISPQVDQRRFEKCQEPSAAAVELKSEMPTSSFLLKSALLVIDLQQSIVGEG